MHTTGKQTNIKKDIYTVYKKIKQTLTGKGKIFPLTLIHKLFG